jgi:hypothetical protein
MLIRARAMIRHPSALSRLVSLLLVIALASLAATLPMRAQPDPADRAELIEAIYPVMIAALEAKQFGRARNICDQVILWEPQNPVHHYNLACIEAQAGGPRIPYAFGALELAAALGFSDVAHLQADPDLKPLRGDPRFAEVVRRMTHNANAGDAIAGLAIPPARPAPATPAAPRSDPDQPAPASFQAGAPVGLYWMSRYETGTRTLEQTVWYFAPDGTVYRNLEHGFSADDLGRHAGPRGRAGLEGRALRIQWEDGTAKAAPLERDPTGFTWDMGIFSPITRFGAPADIPGTYAGGTGSVRAEGPAVVPQRLTLRADGTFGWEGVAFRPGTGTPAARVVSAPDTTVGRWKLAGHSLTLEAESGLTLRRFAFPDDDDRTVVRPDRLFFGGEMLKRQP